MVLRGSEAPRAGTGIEERKCFHDGEGFIWGWIAEGDCGGEGESRGAVSAEPLPGTDVPGSSFVALRRSVWWLRLASGGVEGGGPVFYYYDLCAVLVRAALDDEEALGVAAWAGVCKVCEKVSF